MIKDNVLGDGYRDAIRIVITSGRYRVEDGTIYGPKGKLLVQKRGKQKYPTVSLYFYVSGKRYFYSVPAHKLCAYAYYGDSAFTLVVRHGKRGVLDLTKSNLSLGTHSDNNMDKDPEIRQKAAQIARAAQGHRALNAKLTDSQVEQIKYVCSLNRKSNGHLIRGIATQLGGQYGVSKYVISAIATGKNYRPVG